MKVLHVYRTYFPDPPGGLQEAIRQVCLATQARGVETRIFTLSPTPYPKNLVFPEARVTRSRSWAAPASCDLGGLDAWREYRALAKWADVVHFHFPWPFADLLRWTAGIAKPSVMTYHSDVVRQKALGKLYAPLMRKTLAAMSAVVATSPAYAQTSGVLAALVPKDRLRIIPLGIADYRMNPRSAASTGSSLSERLGLGNRPYFLALGVLRYYKGLHTLIEAAVDVEGTIVIAGSGPEAERLAAQAATLGASNVVFAGQVSADEKVALLEGSRALVLPSHLRSEAFGMVLVEAAMFGRPLVCCEIGTGTSYVNQDGVTGFVVPPESPSRLAEALNALAADPHLADQMGAAARHRYEMLFSGAALGDAYCSVYETVMTQATRR